MNLDGAKKKETVRISKKDLLKLLSDNEHMTRQVKELQTRMTELVEENRVLKSDLPNKVAAPVIDEEDPNDLLDPFPTYHPPFISPDIYFDGSLDAAGPRFRSKE